MSTAICLDDYHRFLDEAEEAIAGLVDDADGGRAAERRGCCQDPCGPLTVLPVEAFAVLQGCATEVHLSARAQHADRCVFLREGGACAIHRVRPFICRASGAPLLFLDENGEWRLDSPGGAADGRRGGAGLRIDAWNARLFRINAVFCGERGIPVRRLPLADLISAIRLFGAVEREGPARGQALAFSGASR